MIIVLLVLSGQYNLDHALSSACTQLPILCMHVHIEFSHALDTPRDYCPLSSACALIASP
jgi:hypothetical protein